MTHKFDENMVSSAIPRNIDALCGSLTHSNGWSRHMGRATIAISGTIRDWLSRIDKDAKESRNKRIFDLWLGCWTQDEIADYIECDRGEVKRLATSFGQNGKSAEMTKPQKAAADHVTDFDPPIYNMWKWEQLPLVGYRHATGQAHDGKWVSSLLSHQP